MQTWVIQLILEIFESSSIRKSHIIRLTVIRSHYLFVFSRPRYCTKRNRFVHAPLGCADRQGHQTDQEAPTVAWIAISLQMNVVLRLQGSRGHPNPVYSRNRLPLAIDIILSIYNCCSSCNWLSSLLIPYLTSPPLSKRVRFARTPLPCSLPVPEEWNRPRQLQTCPLDVPCRNPFRVGVPTNPCIPQFCTAREFCQQVSGLFLAGLF